MKYENSEVKPRIVAYSHSLRFFRLVEHYSYGDAGIITLQLLFCSSICESPGNSNGECQPRRSALPINDWFSAARQPPAHTSGMVTTVFRCLSKH